MSVDIYIAGQRHDDAAPAINLANGNFRKLWTMLGEEPDTWSGGERAGAALDALRVKVVSILAQVAEHPYRDTGTPDRVHDSGPGPTLIEAGWPPGYIHERCTQLLTIIDGALATGSALRWS